MQLSSLPPLRIATVPFYNAWPLTRFLSETLPEATLSGWYPSRMRPGLLAGEIDLALLPVAELPRIPGASLLGDACIGCRGPVESVLLVSRVPVSKIRRIALDVASRSSITLSKVMLHEFYDLRPEIVPLELDESLNAVAADALVVIGDRALAFEPADCWEYRFDLGQWWLEKTGLPFVFAAWIGPPFADPKRQTETVRGLEIARDRGIAAIEQIVAEREEQAARNAVPLLVGRSKLIDYLSRSIQYRLDEEKRKGLELFLKLAAKHL